MRVVGRRPDISFCGPLKSRMASRSGVRTMVAAIRTSDAYNSITVWSATLSPEARAVFAELGFSAADETREIKVFTPGLLVRSLCEGADEPDYDFHGRAIAEIDDWDLRMIYSDYF